MPQFERAVAAACAADPWLRDNPAEVSWPGGQFASGWLDQAHPLIGEVGAAIHDLSGALSGGRCGARTAAT